MESLFNPKIDHDLHHDHVSNSCSSSSSSINGEEEDDEGEDVNSTSSPLQDMSSLLLQLPLKRGLSKHYNGKSQSFSSLSDVKCVEDLCKQENPFNKKLKTCKSYGGGGGFARKHSSSKKGPLNMGRSHIFSRFNGRRNSTFFNINNNNNINKPPIPPPHRSTSSLIF